MQDNNNSNQYNQMFDDSFFNDIMSTLPDMNAKNAKQELEEKTKLLESVAKKHNETQEVYKDKYADFKEFEGENGEIMLIKYDTNQYEFRGNKYCAYIKCNEKTGEKEEGIAQVKNGQYIKVEDQERVAKIKNSIFNQILEYSKSQTYYVDYKIVDGKLYILARGGNKRTQYFLLGFMYTPMFDRISNKLLREIFDLKSYQHVLQKKADFTYILNGQSIQLIKLDTTYDKDTETYITLCQVLNTNYYMLFTHDKEDDGFEYFILDDEYLFEDVYDVESYFEQEPERYPISKPQPPQKKNKWKFW